MRVGMIAALLCVCFGVSKIEGKCSSNFGGCDKSHGLCWDTEEGTSFCTCKAGYDFTVPSTRSGKCVNINECKKGLHSCDTVHGRCVDTIGSHRCVCNTGYVLDYTRTKCLLKTKITGLCTATTTHRFTHYYDFRKFIVTRFSASSDETKTTTTCTCETGYELRNGCKYCQDINECLRRLSKCDLTHGYCHNSVGGYYCSCKTGYVLGPCGFKCYTVSKRPSECKSSVLKSSSLIKGDSDGLNDEVSKAVLLDYITEKTAKAGKIIAVIETFQYQNCTKSASTKTQKIDVNGDGKVDEILHYTCLDGLWQAKGSFNKEAYWTQWSCWTKCRPTCSGGVQTRTRTCKNGLVGEGKCSGAATEYKSCYAGTRCSLRVRRNATTLTSTQKKDLIQAMTKYKKDTSTYGFWNAAASHIFPKQCMSQATGKADGCCYHGAKLNFVIWHRAELLNFEEGLSRHLKDKTLGLPYWDWVSEDAAPSLAWDKKINGQSNPFANMTIRWDLGKTTYLQRSATPLPFLVQVSRDAYLNTARKLMQAHTIHEFSEELENAHNTIHAAICTDSNNCVYSMASLTYAAYDPIFFFHHTNVDRLFANFQQWMLTHKETAWTRQSALEPQEHIYHFNEPFNPFRNTTLTGYKRVNVLSTMQDLYYYELMLGYRYDSLKVPESTAKKSSDSEKSHTVTATTKLNIVLWERNLESNVKISYYITDKITDFTDFKGPCSSLSESDKRFVKSVTILGSNNERPWKSRQPVVTELNTWFANNGQALTKSGIKNIHNMHIKSCYTHNISCTSKCTQVNSTISNKLPDAQLMMYPKYINDDVFKFLWDKNIRLPAWTINFDSGSQWIYFWGDEAKNVVQVNSWTKFKNCDVTGAIKATCTGACILPQGYHYFVNKDKKLCQKGLKLSVLSVL